MTESKEKEPVEKKVAKKEPKKTSTNKKTSPRKTTAKKTSAEKKTTKAKSTTSTTVQKKKTTKQASITKDVSSTNEIKKQPVRKKSPSKKASTTVSKTTKTNQDTPEVVKKKKTTTKKTTVKVKPVEEVKEPLIEEVKQVEPDKEKVIASHENKTPNSFKASFHKMDEFLDQKINKLADLKTSFAQKYQSLKQKNLLFKRTMKGIKIVLIASIVLSGFSFVTYYGYVHYSFHRIADQEELDVTRHKTWYLHYDQDYSAFCYNIKYGAFIPSYSYYNDLSYNSSGIQISGKKIIAESEKEITENLQQIDKLLKAHNCDFYALQEVDVTSDRSYRYNEKIAIYEGLKKYSKVFAYNYHTSYIAYPALTNLGVLNSGLVSASNYRVETATRFSLSSETNFFAKITSKDYCYTALYVPIAYSSQYLTLVNVELSNNAEIRATQWNELNQFINHEYEAGNYIVIAGDFNENMQPSNFIRNQSDLSTNIIKLDEHFSYVVPTNSDKYAVNRNSSVEYNLDTSSLYYYGGFIISDNITASAEIVNTNYAMSSYNPIKLTFKFNKPQKNSK